MQQIAQDHVVISDLKTNTEYRVAYTEILQVKEIKDHHFWNRKLFPIAAVIGAAFLIAAIYPNEP